MLRLPRKGLGEPRVMMSKSNTNYDLDGVRQIARRLEMAMDSLVAIDPTEFVAAIAEYQRLAEYVNERLQDAHDRLRQGNRTDAISSIESEPNAIDCLQELDAVDSKLESWQETCDLLELRRPPRLLSELAEELCSQYDARHQLSNELRTHRLLALGGGSLEQRVATLRRLLQLDPDNQLWEQDLGEYEKQFQIQLQQSLVVLSRGLEAGVTPAMAAQVEAVCRRLADAEWREPVDAAIVRQSQLVLERVRVLHNRAELVNVGASLVSCHAVDDAVRAAALYAQWDRLVAKSDLSPDDPLLKDTEEARTWMQQYCERRAAQERMAGHVSTLSALCAQSTPWTPGAASRRSDQLRAAQRSVQVSAAHVENAGELAGWNAAADRKIQDLQRSVRLFYGATSVAILLAISVVSTASYLVWQRYERATIVDATLAEVERLRGSGQYSDVWGYIEERFAAHPWLEAYGKTRHLPGEVEAEKNKAAQTDKSIDKELIRVAEAVEACDSELEKLRGFRNIEPGIFPARDAVLNRLNSADQTIADVQKLLTETRQRGSTDDGPRNSVTRDVRDRVALQRKEYRSCLTLVRDTEVERIRAQVRELGKNKLDNGAFNEAAGDIKERIAEVERLSGKPEASLLDDLASLIKASERESLITDVQRNLDRASKKGPVELLKALKLAKGRLPTSLAVDADAVVSGAACVDSAIKWSVVADHWHPAVTGARDAVESWITALQEAMALPKPFPDDGPLAEQLATLTECLQQALKPEPEILSDLQPLEDLLGSAVMQPDVIEIVDGEAIYYTTLNAAKKRACHFKDEETVDDRMIGANFTIRDTLADEAPLPARHVKLAESLRKAVDRIKTDEVSFDDGILEMVDIVYAPLDSALPERQPEPLLRTKLLSLILDIARTRTLFSDNAAIEKLAEDIGVKVGEVSWVLRADPASQKENSAEERLEAKKILAKSSWAKTIRDASDKKKSTLGRQPEFCRRLEYVGWANATGDGEGTLSGAPESVRLEGRAGTIYTVSADKDADVAWRFSDCGTLRDGKVTLRSVHAAMFGQPLFLERTAVTGDRGKGSKP